MNLTARSTSATRARRVVGLLWLPILAAVAASVVVTVMVWPFQVGPVGFDSAASVIHFDRIVSGTRLEASLITTPKPLLTLVYGALHAAVPDWRVISWATICAFGVSVALVVLLLFRMAPGCPRPIAALIGATALTGGTLLIQDVGVAYAVVWALLGWLGAALAASARPVRPALAGACLAFATLARLETVVITGAIVIVLLAVVAHGRSGGAPRPWTARNLATVAAVALLALPIMLIHDWLLTGDPLFWATVSSRYSAATDTLPSPADVLGAVRRAVTARPLLTVAALGGVVVLLRNRQWEVLLGLLAVGPGLTLLLVAMAVRGTYVSGRYYAGIEIEAALAGAIGLAAGAGWFARAIGARVPAAVPGRSVLAWAPVGLAVLVVLLSGQFAPRMASVRSWLDDRRAYAQVGDSSLRYVRGLLGESYPRGGSARPADAHPMLLVPALLRPRMAEDLDLALWAIAGLRHEDLAPDGGGLRGGQVIVHSQEFDLPRGAYDILETAGGARLGDRIVTPVTELPGPAWVLQVR